MSQPETGAFNSDRTVRRQAWAAQRAALEASDAKHMPDGRPHSRAWGLFTLLLQGLAILLRLLGLYERGVRNALDIGLVEHELVFEGLPPAFDGYRVMHMTDLHLDGHPALPGRIARLVEGVACDLCVLTGDYRFRVHGPWDRVTEAFESIMPAIAATDGIVAVLGNHDAAGMADMLESLGARVPVNSTETLSRGDAAIHVTGIDDPHYYFTPPPPARLSRRRTDSVSRWSIRRSYAIRPRKPGSISICAGTPMADRSACPAETGHHPCGRVQALRQRVLAGREDEGIYRTRRGVFRPADPLQLPGRGDSLHVAASVARGPLARKQWDGDAGNFPKLPDSQAAA